jgi:dTDP-4-amino-4,6-dideoxygalactose transaminase
MSTTTSRSQLALLGGTRAIPEGMEKPWPVITDDDKRAVMSVLDRGVLWGAGAPEVSALQKEWAAYVGTAHCLATNSGTAALHMCVAALGIGPGDEVITTPLSWTSTATCILHHNAIPVFADIEPEGYLLDPRTIEAKITPRTKAILVVHLYGLPADMDGIMEVARRHNLFVIEDCCQAHAAEYKGRKVGTFGQVAAFSLNGSKNLQSGEGGLFVTNDENLWQEAARVQQFGEARRRDGAREYNAYGMGWMYRTSEMPAALARSQLRRLDEWTDMIRDNAHYLSRGLKGLKGFRLPFEPSERKHVFWRYNLRLAPEEIGYDGSHRFFLNRVRAALGAEGVALGRAEFVIPMMTLFQERRGYGLGCPWTCGHYAGMVEYKAEDFPVAMDGIDRIVGISGIKPPNGHDLMDMQVEAIHKVHGQLDALLAAQI